MISKETLWNIFNTIAVAILAFPVAILIVIWFILYCVGVVLGMIANIVYIGFKEEFGTDKETPYLRIMYWIGKTLKNLKNRVV